MDFYTAHIFPITLKSRIFREEAEDYIANELELNEFVIREEIISADEILEIQFSRDISRNQYDEITGRFLYQ